LAGEIWERVPDAQAGVSLRQALLEIGRAMGSLRSEVLAFDRDTVRVRTDRCWIDVLDSRHRAASAPDIDIANLQPERLLEEFEGISAAFDQWLLTERARFAEALRTSFEAGLHETVRSGAPAPDRAAAARRVIAFDPTHEGACRTLMHALVEHGERAQAIKEYARCREAFRRILEA
jgi:DNA-binding SARP family transcriptional activator